MEMRDRPRRAGAGCRAGSGRSSLQARLLEQQQRRPLEEDRRSRVSAPREPLARSARRRARRPSASCRPGASWPRRSRSCELRRHLGLGAVGRHALARRRCPSPYWPRTVAGQDLLGRHRPDGVQHLHLLVAHRLGLRTTTGGSIATSVSSWKMWFWTMSRTTPGRVVVAAAPLHAELLGHRDLHVVDVAPVPDRLEDAVGEAEDQDVLDRLLAEVVVDAVDLVLAQDAA